MKLFLAPHNDDETLFGAFTIMAESPNIQVAIVFDSVVQALRGLPITSEQRRAESSRAIEELGETIPCWDPLFLKVFDTQPHRAELALLRLRSTEYEHVYAPAIEDGGHEHHNLIGEIADRLWPGKVTHYLTYTKAGKSRNGSVVAVQGEWITRKLKALACYRSQIENEGTGCAPHFMNDLWEYYENPKP